MSGDLHERVAVLEKATEIIPKLQEEISALKRFQVTVTTVWATAAAMAAFFAEKIKKVMGL